MTIAYRFHLFLIAAVITVPSAYAQNGSWLNDSAGNWTDPARWTGGIIADGADNTATFGNVINADRIVTLNGNRTIGNITASDTNNNYTLSGSILTLDRTDATAPQINVTTSGRTLTISSQISGSDGLTKVGGGSTLALSGNNSYSGVTAISTGVIAISNNNALGATGSGNNTTIAATGSLTTGGHLQLSGGINSAENITITGATEASGFNGAIRNQSGNNTLSGSIVLSSLTNGVRLDTAAGNLILSGNISQTGSSQGFSLAPASGTTITVNNAIANNGGVFQTLSSGATGTAGTTILAGVNGTGIGATNVAQNSTLQLGGADALNTTAALNIAAFGGTDQGRFNLNGFNQTVNGLNSSATGATRIVSNNHATNASILTVGNGGGSGAFNGTIINGAAATLALVKTGVGNQTLSGTNTYTGGTTITGGTLTLGNATNTLSNTGAINVNGGTLALGSNSDTVGAVTLTSGSITSSTGVLTGTSYAVQSGSVSAILGGSGVALTKTTGGTVTLTGNNTYTGATNVNDGTLLINGSTSASSSVTIGGSGTLGGNGTINGATTVNGLLTPGNSPGVLTFNSTLTLAGNTTLEIDGTTTRGTDFDGVNTVGLLTYGGGLTFDFGTTLSGNETFDLFNIGGGGQTGNFTSVVLTGNYTGSFSQNGTVWELTDGGGNNWNFSQTTGDLTFVAVPEPAAIAILGSAVGLLGLRVARLRKVSFCG